MGATRWGRLAPVVLATILAAGIGACSDGTDDSAGASGDAGTAPDTAAGAGTDADADHGEPVEHHFGYEGEEGPDHWGDTWELCGTGTRQSPIDLDPREATEAGDGDLPDIEFNYRPSALRLVNNGHTVRAGYDPGSRITVAGQVYELTQFHFHAHSEHTLPATGTTDLRTTPLEVHFVHEAVDADDGDGSDDGAERPLAVVGVLVEEGAESAAFAPVMDNLPADVDRSDVAVLVEGETVDAAALLPDDRTFFHYAGSLTTPGCDERVSWQVMTTTVEMSAEQIAAFTDLYAGNARPTQPLGERELVVSRPVESAGD